MSDDRPDWTDPTQCPYEDCGVQGGEIKIEVHLWQVHDWTYIETDFDSESLVSPRDVDSGDQVTLTDGGTGFSPKAEGSSDE